MAGPIRKRKSTTNSNFKRIKAKVGKKALKPANVTDTSFKAASVSVKNQADSFGRQQQKLVSDRGHSISELATQLNHPAAAVRTSAIRGLSNVVDSHSDQLTAHLSALLPVVCKCCVDEDDAVRQLGLTTLKNIMTTQGESTLSPFLALLTAYTTSALNSLDRATRLDGAKAVEILSTTLPSLMGSQAPILIPAFVGLLTDYTKQRRPAKGSGANKKKRNRDAAESTQFTILQGLVALLRTIPDSNRDSATSDSFIDEIKPDLVFVSGGRTVNALLVAPSRETRSVRPINNINDLASFMHENVNGVTIREVATGLSVSVATEIVSKLRDVFIELSQRSESVSSIGTLQELSLLNEAIHLLWNSYCHGMIEEGVSDSKETARLRKVFLSLLSLTMESFPVVELASNAELATKSSVLNADLCSTLMDIGGYLEAKDLDWTRNVLDYLLPRLETDASHTTLVDVLSKLLLLKHDSTEFSLPGKTRRKVLDKMCKIFFSGDFKADAARIASSRRAALMIVEMLGNESFLVNDNAVTSSSLQMALKQLPFFLQAWKGDYLMETSAVLSAIQDVVRRLDLESESNRDILECLRTGLSSIFELPKRTKKAKRSQEPPIFELFPVEMQQQALGLLVMLQSPSEATISGLGYMCARCGIFEGAISPMIADAAMYASYLVRRSMSMQAYLSFLVKSVGIADLAREPKEERNVDATCTIDNGSVDEPPTCGDAQKSTRGEIRDRQVTEDLFDMESLRASEGSVLRAARYFSLCGSKKVLPMINGVLSDWLTAMSPSVGMDSSHRAIRFRAATAIIAMLILDTNAGIEDAAPAVSAVSVVPQLVPSICDLFEFCFSRSTSNQDSGDSLEYLIQPIVALMKGDKRVVESLLDLVFGRTCESKLSTTEASTSAYIEGLLAIVRYPELSPVLRDIPETIARCCESIESALAGNSGLERQARSLRTAAELVTGGNNMKLKTID